VRRIRAPPRPRRRRVIDAVGMEAHGSPVACWRRRPRRSSRRDHGRVMQVPGRPAGALNTRSRSSGAAGRSRCPGSTAAPATRCR
jgi:hypothetical protein